MSERPEVAREDRPRTVTRARSTRAPSFIKRRQAMNKRDALRTIAAEAASGIPTFPSHVQVASRVSELVDDPDCNIDAVARLVKAEPLLSARVVGVANSAALNATGRRITNARSAIARIGLETTRALAVAEVARYLASLSARPTDRVLATQVWRHSVHVAALARVLAKRVTQQTRRPPCSQASCMSSAHCI